MSSWISHVKPHRRHCFRPPALLGLAAALGLVALSLVVLAAVAPLGAASPSARAASASGYGTILVSPAAGGPRATLSLDIRITADPTATYELRYTTADPAQGGCSGAQPMPVAGLNPFKLGTEQNQGGISFTWPAILGSDQYYFCVYQASSNAQTPTSGATPAATATPTNPQQYATGELAHSIAPYAATRDPAPEISVALPGSTAPTTDNIPLGGTFSAVVNDWKSPQGTCPTHLWLLMPDNISRAELPFTIIRRLDANRQCALQVKASPVGSDVQLSPGQYPLLAGDSGIYQESAPLGFVAAALPTTAPGSPTVPVTTPHQISSSDSTGLSALVYALSGLALLVALGLVATVIVFALRTRRDTRQDAMSQMGLDVEPLQSSPTREPGRASGSREPRDSAPIHASIRLSNTGRGWGGERDGDDYWQPPARSSSSSNRPPTPRR